ncbi:MAG: aldo/keto reductase [Alphaproteobacteria bacterium]|nr:aldo/keto reductase [Alphaproteobacteria bacterium]
MAGLADAPRRRLGGSGLTVAPIGLGCVSIAGAYGPSDDASGIRLLHAAMDAGVDHFDTADLYGLGHNEEIIGQAVRGRAGKVVVATKFGQIQRNPPPNAIDGSPAYVVAACEASLRRLGVETIDLYYQHRLDPKVPIEETVGAMKRLVEQGKVRALGLSEVNAATIRRAHAVHPVAVVQNEYSLLYREDAEEALVAMRERDIALVAYAPLGRSLLAGTAPGADGFAKGDLRGTMPRFAGENFARNHALTDQIAAFARAKGCTAAQLSLTWLLAQGKDILPIPGTKRPERLAENIAAVDIGLTPRELVALDAIAPRGAASGTRYPEYLMDSINL